MLCKSSVGERAFAAPGIRALWTRRASGVLVILVGPAVRLSEFRLGFPIKRYQATIRMGSSTNTYDAEGPALGTASLADLDEEQFEELLQQYVGEIEQTPPPYSAVKVQGKKAYQRAREGEDVEIEPRKINVYSLDLLEWALPEVVIDVFCSSGTYVRSLAHDLGEALNVGAHLVGLRRTKSGRFTLRDAVSLRRLRESFDLGGLVINTSFQPQRHSQIGPLVGIRRGRGRENSPRAPHSRRRRHRRLGARRNGTR